MGNGVAVPRLSFTTDVRNRRAPPVIGYKIVPKDPASALGDDDTQTSALTPLDLQWKYYVKTYREGDPELPEDPAFPQRLIDKIQERDFPTAGHPNASGSYIFYPDRSKPKMWVGQYRCLNPQDLLTCGIENGCAVGEVMGCFPASGDEVVPEDFEQSETADSKEETTGDVRGESPFGPPSATCGLLRSCLQPFAAERGDSEQSHVQNLHGGQSFLPCLTPLEKQLAHDALQHSMKQRMAVATGSQFAHENLSTRLNFAQQLFSNDLPVMSVDTRVSGGVNGTPAPPLFTPHVTMTDSEVAAGDAGQLPPFMTVQHPYQPPLPFSQAIHTPQYLQPGLVPPVLFS